jgi:hypothetical protein
VKRLLGSITLVVVVAACGGGPVTPTQRPGQPTQAPGGTTTVPQPGGGNTEAKARALVPPGSTELSATTQGNSYSLIVSTAQTIEQVGAFYQQAIPAAGLTETGRFTLGDTLTISVSNPDGGIVAVKDPSQGRVVVTISLGIS